MIRSSSAPIGNGPVTAGGNYGYVAKSYGGVTVGEGGGREGYPNDGYLPDSRVDQSSVARATLPSTNDGYVSQTAPVSYIPPGASRRGSM